MPFKPNYNQARSERTRAKQLKKAEKLRQQQEKTIERQTEREVEDSETDEKRQGSADTV